LPIRVDRIFHRSSAAKHSMRDTRGGRFGACLRAVERKTNRGRSAAALTRFAGNVLQGSTQKQSPSAPATVARRPQPDR